MSVASALPRAGPRLGFFSRLLDRVDAATRYDLLVEQVRTAERLGFETAWVAQHHFDPEEGGLPSPFVLLAHVAGQTRRIRLGTGVVTLPLENPIRVAEDAAVVDLLSRGRLEVGVGSGNSPTSYPPFGLEHAGRAALHAGNLDILRRAWRGEDMPGGKRLYPAAPHLAGRIWQATFSAEGATRIGTAGDGLMLSRSQPRPAEAPNMRLDDLQDPVIDAYLRALPSGREPRILASRSLFVADTREEARRFAGVGLRRAVARDGARKRAPADASLDGLIELFDAHVGAPEDVVASLVRDRVLSRATDIVFQVHSIDPPHESILRSLELTAQRVAPALGWMPGTRVGAASRELEATP